MAGSPLSKIKKKPSIVKEDESESKEDEAGLGKRYLIPAVKFLFVLLLGAVIVASFSQPLAQYIPQLDTWNPTIIDIIPKPNSQVDEIDDFKFVIWDIGTGVDVEKTSVSVFGSVSGEIDGEFNRIDKETFVFTPKSTLGPDIYTISINPYDKKGNRLDTPYSFVVFVTETPKINIEFKQNMIPKTSLRAIFGNQYRPSLESYSILLDTEDNRIYSIEDFKLNLELPYPVVDVRMSAGITLGGFGCTPITDFKISNSAEGFIFFNGKEINQPSCKISISREKLAPNSCGFIELFVDNSSGGWACNNNSFYRLTYFWNEYGIRKTNETSGVIIAKGPTNPN